MSTSKRPPVANNPNIPLPVARELRKVAQFAFDAQDNAQSALDALPGKVSKTPADLIQVSKFVSQQVQAGGAAPISLTGLIGSPSGAVISVNGLTGAITISQGVGVTVSIVSVGSTRHIQISLPNVGPGPGTYVTGLKLTGPGTNGSITIDAEGRITAVTQAT